MGPNISHATLQRLDIEAFIRRVFNPLSTNLTKWSNTLEQFFDSCRRIA